ncbi:MAG: OmpA family protein [Enhygromyxa sp.]
MGAFSPLKTAQPFLSKALKSSQPRGWLKYENLDCDFPIKIIPDNADQESKRLHTVKFEQDSIRMTDSRHYEALDIIGERLPPGEAELYVYGYASHEGDADYNGDLSCARANIVKEILSGSHGQAVARAAGMGEINPQNEDDPPNPDHRKAEIWAAYQRPQAKESELEKDGAVQMPDRTECWRKNGVRMAAQVTSRTGACIMDLVKQKSANFTRIPQPGYWDQYLTRDDVHLIDQMPRKGLSKDKDGKVEFPNKLSSQLSKCLVLAACYSNAGTDEDLKRGASVCLGGVNRGLNWLDFLKAMAWGDKKIHDVWDRVRERHGNRESIYGCYPIPTGSLNLE